MNSLPKHCVPCGKGAVALSMGKARILIKNLKNWRISKDGKWLHKAYKFKNFKLAIAFTNEVGEIAEAENHHPDIELGWGYTNIKLQTHSVGGLHENDFILAAKIDQLQ